MIARSFEITADIFNKLLDQEFFIVGCVKADFLSSQKPLAAS